MEHSEDYEEKRKLNNLLKLYAKDVSGEIILIAIKMYEEGKSLDEIESFLKMERERTQSLRQVDYYGGRTLRESREEDFER